MSKEISIEKFCEEQKERDCLKGQFQAIQIIGNALRERVQKHILQAMKDREITVIDFTEIDDSIIPPPAIKDTAVLHRISSTKGKIKIEYYDDDDDYENKLENLPYEVVMTILETFEEIINAFDDEEYYVDEDGYLYANN